MKYKRSEKFELDISISELAHILNERDSQHTLNVGDYIIPSNATSAYLNHTLELGQVLTLSWEKQGD